MKRRVLVFDGGALLLDGRQYTLQNLKIEFA